MRVEPKVRPIGKCVYCVYAMPSSPKWPPLPDAVRVAATATGLRDLCAAHAATVLP